MVAVTVAVLLPLAWFYFRGETDSHLRSRTLEQAEISWRCERDHLFMAAGQDGSRICWICGAIAYPVGNYICEVHGAYEVAVQFVTDDAGITTVKQVRVPKGTWLSPQEGLRCPRCARPLTYPNPDPMNSLLGGSRKRIP